MSGERVDIRAVAGDRDPLDVALRWLDSRHQRDLDAALIYLCSEPDRAEPALLDALEAGEPRRDRVAMALGHLGRETSVPGLISVMHEGTEYQRMAIRSALRSIGGSDAEAALADAASASASEEE